MKAKPLDARTLRAASVRLRKRCNRLRRGVQFKDVTWGRAAEADLQADNMLSEARTIERKAKASKGGRK